MARIKIHDLSPGELTTGQSQLVHGGEPVDLRLAPDGDLYSPPEPPDLTKELRSDKMGTSKMINPSKGYAFISLPEDH
jgi:hypothetical protein